MNPKMYSKLYLRNIKGGRKIEEMLKENIDMIWICGMKRPDQHTIVELLNTPRYAQKDSPKLYLAF